MSDNRADEYKKKILNILKNAFPDDLTTIEIARQLNVHRNTVVRYLGELVGEGKLKSRRIGKYVLYRILK